MDQLSNLGIADHLDSLAAVLMVLTLIGLTYSIRTTVRLRREIADIRSDVRCDLRRAITDVHAVVEDLRTTAAPQRHGASDDLRQSVQPVEILPAASGHTAAIEGDRSGSHHEYDGWMGRSAECLGGLLLFGFAAMWAGGWGWATGTIAVPWIADLLSTIVGGLANGELLLVIGRLVWLLLALVVGATFALLPTILAVGIAVIGLLHVLHAMLRAHWLNEVLRRIAGRQAALAL